MDYIALNVSWIIANIVLEVLSRTILSNILGSRQLMQLGKTSIPFLQTLDKTDAKHILAVIIFVVFTLITIKKYNREKDKDALGFVATIILGIVQLWVIFNFNF